MRLQYKTAYMRTKKMKAERKIRKTTKLANNFKIHLNTLPITVFKQINSAAYKVNLRLTIYKTLNRSLEIQEF
jgi:hypothetical protein